MKCLIMAAVQAVSWIGLTLTLDTTTDGAPKRVAATSDPKAIELVREVRVKGWIVYSAKTGAGDWDLFLMRPGRFQPKKYHPYRNIQ